MTRLRITLGFIAVAALAPHAYAITDQEIEAALNQHMGHFAGMVTQEYRGEHFDGIKKLVAAGKDVNDVAKGIMDAVNSNTYPSDYLRLQQNGLSHNDMKAIQSAAHQPQNVTVSGVIAHKQAGQTVGQIQQHFSTLGKPQAIYPGTPEYAALMGQAGGNAGAPATLFELPGKDSSLKGEEVEAAFIAKFGFNPYAEGKMVKHARIKKLVQDKAGLDKFIDELDDAHKKYVTPDEFLGLKENGLSVAEFIEHRKKSPKDAGMGVLTAMTLKKNNTKS